MFETYGSPIIPKYIAVEQFMATTRAQSKTDNNQPLGKKVDKSYGKNVDKKVELDVGKKNNMRRVIKKDYQGGRCIIRRTVFQ